MVELRYTLAFSRPACSSAAVSPCRMAEPFWMRWLCDAPTTESVPVPSTSAMMQDPMGTPPSLALFFACASAVWSPSASSYFMARTMMRNFVYSRL